MIIVNVFKAIDYVFNSIVQTISDSLDDFGYAVKNMSKIILTLKKSIGQQKG